MDGMVEHAWRYFALHSTQRMSLFNFFLVVSASLSAALAASLQGAGIYHALGVALGGLLAVVSLVFWKLDQRTRFLVKHAEAALSELEAGMAIPAARLVSNEPSKTDAAKEGFVLFRMWTYNTAFRVVFVIMGVFGVIGGGISLCKYVAWL